VYDAKNAVDSACALRLLRRRCTRPVMSTEKQPRRYRSLNTMSGPVSQDNGITAMKATHRPRRMSARTTALANQGKTGTKMGQLLGTGGQSECGRQPTGGFHPLGGAGQSGGALNLL
jgi:hypothetical protein